MADLYPFPAEDPDFKIDPPSSSQRLWLAKEIHEGRLNGPDLAKRFNSTSHFMRVLKYKYQKGLGFNGSGGRPRALDDVSITNLRHLLAPEVDGDNEDLRSELNAEYSKTFSRRRPKRHLELQEAGKLRVMPRRTRKRYLRQLFLDGGQDGQANGFLYDNEF